MPQPLLSDVYRQLALKLKDVQRQSWYRRRDWTGVIGKAISTLESWARSFDLIESHFANTSSQECTPDMKRRFNTVGALLDEIKQDVKSEVPDPDPSQLSSRFDQAVTELVQFSDPLTIDDSQPITPTKSDKFASFVLPPLDEDILSVTPPTTPLFNFPKGYKEDFDRLLAKVEEVFDLTNDLTSVWMGPLEATLVRLTDHRDALRPDVPPCSEARCGAWKHSYRRQVDAFIHVLEKIEMDVLYDVRTRDPQFVKDLQRKLEELERHCESNYNVTPQSSPPNAAHGKRPRVDSGTASPPLYHPFPPEKAARPLIYGDRPSNEDPPSMSSSTPDRKGPGWMKNLQSSGFAKVFSFRWMKRSV